MPKRVIANLEEVEEPLRPFYKKNEADDKDTKFYLDLEDYEDPTPLRRNLEAARRSERAMKQQVEAWEKLGLSQEDITALKEKAAKEAELEAERKGEWEKLKGQMNEKHLQELKKKDLDIEAERGNSAKLKGQIERFLVDAKATAAIAAAEGEPELLLPLVKRFIKVEQDENGEFSTSIVDDKGGPRVNGKGDPLTIEELLAEMKSSEKLGRAFKASGSSGGGSPPGGGHNPKNPPPGTPKSWNDAKTPEDKAKFLLHQRTAAAKAG